MEICYRSLLIGVVAIIVLLLVLAQLGKVEFTWKSEHLGEQVPRFYQWQSSV